ncbi:TlpA family protein disulfide reductase [Altericroceibacterium xinjiangense]|uniref:TlpA family protein disulfide reductase n=1 Tax=Altericroceibacterium xinjiangense TaxID=762261 RepID=UPI000F7D81BA|nr:TlpA disulfide reductase family protein [Altericroceibacterium xinjiangense]
MVRSVPFSLMLAFAAPLAIGGCDRQTAEPAQPQESAAAENAGAEPAASLTGTVDRSHAGEPLPDVTITGPNDLKLNLAELKGGPILVNLWATWCAPCVVEMPMLDQLAGEEGAPRVLAVSEDLQGAEVVNPFWAEHRFGNLQPWLDPENDLSMHYGGGGAVLPTTVLYNAAGEEVWRVIGGYDWSSEEARELVAEAQGA